MYDYLKYFIISFCMIIYWGIIIKISSVLESIFMYKNYVFFFIIRIYLFLCFKNIFKKLKKIIFFKLIFFWCFHIILIY